MATAGIEVAKEATDVKSELIDDETRRQNLQYLAKNYPSQVKTVVLSYSAIQLEVMIEDYLRNELCLDDETVHKRLQKAMEAILKFKSKPTARGRKV